MTFKQAIRSFFKSKTIRFQIICAGLIVAEANLGLVKVYLGEHYNLILFAIIGINTYLRTVTKESLADK